jgi:hypothetical protein
MTYRVTVSDEPATKLLLDAAEATDLTLKDEDSTVALPQTAP